jgi:CubicO group peptidase (beta-lactamase class C family)
LQQALDGQCVKYAFVLYHGLAHVSHSSGKKRTAADPPEQDFTEDYRYNPASVTKTITAVALLQLLAKKGISIEDKIWKYLPADWNIHSSFKQINFRQVLSHHSGIVNDVWAADYGAVKLVIENGITLSDTATRAYMNVNYSICRILIAYLDGYTPNSASDQSQGTSQRFIRCLQRGIFDKINISNVSFAPTTAAPTLFYPWPAGTAHGTDWGDWTLSGGSAGVQLSTNELATFLVQLRLSTILLSDSMKTIMDRFSLGWDLPMHLNDGVNVQLKGGLLGDSASGHARLSTGILDFDNGLQMTVVINGWPDAISLPLDVYTKAWTRNP